MQNKIRFIKDLLWFLIFWGVVAAIFRIWFGLGATTNLTDEIPWGLWKVLNMIAGVALSTCGFTLGFLVYVLKMERFKPLVRPAILIAFLGYGCSCMALLFDIGLPQRFWHPFLMWNEHSFLFEVFWCVILYFTVTFIELIPNILERYKADKIVKFLHKVSIGVVILGISLSSLHHSSLGSLFLTTPLRLHELWYTPLLPWMFIVSAMGSGMMFLIFVKILYARLYEPESVFGINFKKTKDAVVCSLDGSSFKRVKLGYGKEMPMLSGLAIISASLLGFYLILKVYNLFYNSSINALLAGTWESWLFSSEIIITAVIPIVLVLIKRTRHSPYGLAIASFSASAGLALNRMDVGIFGYFRDSQTIYIPTLAEWSLSIGVIAAAAIAFVYIAENFSIFNDNWKEQKIKKGAFHASFDSFSRVWTAVLQNGLYRISLLGVFILPIAYVSLYPPFANTKSEVVIPASGVDVNRYVLLINGNDNGKHIAFPHSEHQKRMGGEKSCSECHHMSMPNDNSTPCARCHKSMFDKTKIFDHSYHIEKVAQNKKIGGLVPENHTCTICHKGNQAKTSDNTIKCTDCHFHDMHLKNHPNSGNNFVYANSYMDAMHTNCITCHLKQELNYRKKLSDCSTCHKNTKIFPGKKTYEMSIRE